MALDLYDGKVATTREDAGSYMKSTTEERSNAIIQGAINHAGENAKIATVGWCFGGGWSLKSSILLGEQGAGCVIYYGMPVQEADKIKPLKADVLGIFAEKDGWITPEVVDKFKATATGIGKKVTVHQFDAAHAFANPSSERYDKESATKANALVLDFLKESLSVLGSYASCNSCLDFGTSLSSLVPGRFPLVGSRYFGFGSTRVGVSTIFCWPRNVGEWIGFIWIVAVV